MPGYVEVELDKPRRLRLDINALADAEEVLGAPVPALIDQLGYRTLRALIWAGLKWEDQGLTLHAAGDLIQSALNQGRGPGELGKAVRQALEASGIIRPSRGGERNPPPEAGGRRGASPSGSGRRRPSPTAPSASSPTSSGA